MSRRMEKYNFTKITVGLLTVFKYICYLMVIVYASSSSNTCYTIMAFISCLVAVILSFSEKTMMIKDNSVTQFLGKISLPIFLVHCVVRRVGLSILGEDAELWKVLILIAISLISAYVVMVLTECVLKLWKKYKTLFIYEK